MPRPSGRSATKGRRRGDDDGDDVSGRWLTTYADAITLLMAFFVMLYAMSEIDVVKFTAFLQGLRVPFGNESGDGTMPASDGLLPDVAVVPPGEPDDPPEIPSRFIERHEGDEDADGEVAELINAIETQSDELGLSNDELLEMIEDLEANQEELGIDDLESQVLADAHRRAEMEAQLDQVQESLTTALTQEGVEVHVEQRRTERGLVVTIASDNVLFALGSTTIDGVGREIVEVIATTLDDFPNQVQIEGHTDTVPLDRNGYTNWNLSTDRAVAVLSSMIEEHGLSPDRVGAVGYGEYRPFTSNDTVDGRARNRRVDVVVLLEEPES